MMIEQNENSEQRTKQTNSKLNPVKCLIILCHIKQKQNIQNTYNTKAINEKIDPCNNIINHF